MKRWLVRIILLGVLAAAGIWIWHSLFPSPEQVIRKKLDRLARTASIAPNESQLARLANAQKLANFFTTNIEITVNVSGHSPHTISGKDDLLEKAIGARATLSGLTVDFLDVSIILEGDRQSAVANLTAKADIPGESVPEVEELRISLRKVEGDWLVERAETVKTLR